MIASLPDRIWILLAALITIDVALLIYLLRTGLERKPRRGGYLADRWRR